MTLEENKAIVRRWIEAYNQRNLDLFDEFVSSDYFDHTNQVDAEGLRQLFGMGFAAFPDWHETIEDIIAEGDRVWVRLSYAGTHTGEFRGLAPTGNPLTATAVDIYRIVDGKLAEYWSVMDSLNFHKQTGAIEYTEQGKKFFSEEAE